MSDELDARVRSLNAERQRPERVVELPDLLMELIRTLHALFLTPPDKPLTSDNEAAHGP